MNNEIFPLDRFYEEDIQNRIFLENVISWLYTKLPANFSAIYVCKDRFRDTSYVSINYSKSNPYGIWLNIIININMNLSIPSYKENVKMDDYNNHEIPIYSIEDLYQDPRYSYIFTQNKEICVDIFKTFLLHSVVHEWMHTLTFTDAIYSESHNEYNYQIEYLVNLKTHNFILQNKNEIEYLFDFEVNERYLTELLNSFKRDYFNDGIFPLK